VNYSISENVIYDYVDININPAYASTYKKIFVAIDSPYVEVHLNMSLDNESWKQLLNCFAGSSELFPLLEKHSYAKFILEKGQNDKWVI